MANARDRPFFNHPTNENPSAPKNAEVPKTVGNDRSNPTCRRYQEPNVSQKSNPARIKPTAHQNQRMP